MSRRAIVQAVEGALAAVPAWVLADRVFGLPQPFLAPSFENGCGNVWRGNRSDLGGVGQYAINITSTSKCSGNPNVVYVSNTVSGAVKGLTNIPVTP